MKKLQFFILVIFISSCQKPKQEGIITIPTESAKEKNVSNLVEEVSFYPLFGELGQVPYGVEKIVLTEELILLGDFNFSQSLFAFNRANGKAITVPIQKGEGPMEVREVDDFWVDGDLIYVLDGIGRKILPISYSNLELILKTPIQLEIPVRRFAKTKDGFVGLTGGGQENELAFFDQNGKLISTHFPHSISYLMLPLNPFQKIPKADGFQIVFHSNFDPVFYDVGEGFLATYDTLRYKGEAIKVPEKTDFVMDLEGFEQYRGTLKDQPSLFMVFESSADQSILLYSLKNETNFALFWGDQHISYPSKNLINDLTFDYNIGMPIAMGASESKFLTTIHKEHVNQEDPEFEGSKLQKAILSNPEVEVFLMEFRLKTNTKL
ncbi:6-bladed beta-propeller [Algoriphagus machipongonensis]|uniref:Lipoprotein n=1 Tax=Algoriphagus machipongonensis TaxID=388413 RepID=A3HXI9_9BACT|nr:6-bladed beta-propeller [Algoriphagus machipongonensis]EAZ81312.1 hypothetical protein ALPR1_19788 [Algoriphagus machipongonensis]